MIEPTRLDFTDHRCPRSRRFEDVYFSPVDGVLESEYVYLEGSGFLDRLDQGQSFTVGEIGFGVGLNFILSLRAFIQRRKPGQTLSYYSAERFPVVKEDLITLYQSFPDLQEYTSLLLNQYPFLSPGFHCLHFQDVGVTLHLLLGDAKECFSQVQSKIDIWYWDGFSPQKNPEAWGPTLFEVVARISTPQATGASFTAAGWVRRMLEDSGFTIIKRDGFAKKRECIRANFSAKTSVASSSMVTHPLPMGTIAVLGAGLAGTAIAQALTKRGHTVALIDQSEIAGQTSGNPVGLFNVQISKLPNPISRFSQASLLFFLREIATYERSADLAKKLQIRRGIFRQDVTLTGEQTTLDALNATGYSEGFAQAMDTASASDTCGIHIQHSGLYLPNCGILSPQELCMIRSQGSTLYLHHQVQMIERLSDRFVLTLHHQGKVTRLEAEHIIYTTGNTNGCGDHALSHYPLRPIRGQLLYAKPNELSRNLKVTLVDQGYFTPVNASNPQQTQHVIGATYQAKTIHENQEQLDQDFLLHELSQKWESLRSITKDHIQGLRVGYRISTPDKLPIIGRITSEDLEPKPREWVFTGLGSRGITQSSLGAEYLAELICNEPLGAEKDLWAHLQASRFFQRQLKRNQVKIKP